MGRARAALVLGVGWGALAAAGPPPVEVARPDTPMAPSASGPASSSDQPPRSTLPAATPARAGPGTPVETEPVRPPQAPPRAPVPAEPSPPPDLQSPSFDLGVTAGFNNPGGIVGGTLEHRLVDFFALGLAGGPGLWGFRLTPSARLYPFGVHRTALFLEGGLAFNFGGAIPETVTRPSGVTRTVIQQELEPAAHLALGLRRAWLRYFFTSVEIGWQFNLRPGAFHAVDNGPLDGFATASMLLSQPGGFLIGVSAGISLF